MGHRQRTKKLMGFAQGVGKGLLTLALAVALVGLPQSLIAQAQSETGAQGNTTPSKLLQAPLAAESSRCTQPSTATSLVQDVSSNASKASGVGVAASSGDAPKQAAPVEGVTHQSEAPKFAVEGDVSASGVDASTTSLAVTDKPASPTTAKGTDQDLYSQPTPGVNKVTDPVVNSSLVPSLRDNGLYLSPPSQTFYESPGEKVNFDVVVLGWPSTAGFDFSITDGVLPSGLNLKLVHKTSHSTANISGTIAPNCAPGSYKITVFARWPYGDSVTTTYTFVIGSSPQITQAQTLPSIDMPASAYSQPLASNSASLSTDPHTTWSISGGQPPAWLSIDSKTGVLSGNPTPGSGGTYHFTVQLATNFGSTTKDFTLVINEVPNIITVSLSHAVVGEAYSYQLQASPAATHWEVTGLPAGLAINSDTGVIAGTPRVGTDRNSPYQVTITASNDLGSSVPVTLSLSVGTVPVVTTTSLDHFSVGTHSSCVLAAKGSPATWTCTNPGSLPSGLTFNTNGTLSGTPAQGTGGSYNLMVTCSNTFGTSKVATIPFEVYEAPHLVAPVLSHAQKGKVFTANLGITQCFPAPVYSISSGALPEGMQLDAASGVLRGTPQASGSFEATVTSTNAEGTSSVPFTLVVDDPPVITTTQLFSAEVGKPYTVHLEATGYPRAFTWSVAEGSLPQGLILNAQSGAITGTPTATLGTYHVIIACTNGVSPDTQHDYDLVVGRPPTIETTQAPPAYANTPYTTQLEASGSPEVFSWTLAQASSLPEGLTLNERTGVITGTPPAPGHYNFDVLCDNGVGSPARRSFTIDVDASPLITTDTVPAIQAGEQLSLQLETNQCWPVPTWNLVAGSKLPAGISLTDSGKLTGSTDSFGLFSFTVACDNGVGKADTKNYVLEINRSAHANNTALPSGQVGSFYSTTLTATGWPYTFTWGVASPGGAALPQNVSGVKELSRSSVVAARSVDGSLVAGQPDPSVFGQAFVLPTTKAFMPHTRDTAIDLLSPRSIVDPVALVDGLFLNPSTGQVSGTPLTAGDFKVCVTVTNGIGQPDMLAVTLHVDPAPASSASASGSASTGTTTGATSASTSGTTTGGASEVTGATLFASAGLVATGDALPYALFVVLGISALVLAIALWHRRRQAPR